MTSLPRLEASTLYHDVSKEATNIDTYCERVDGGVDMRGPTKPIESVGRASEDARYGV
jgi:hypothetical protein